MSHMEQHISIACPQTQAAMRLKHFFGEHETSDADTAKLNLQITVNLPGLPTPLTLQRSVIATIRPHHLVGDMTLPRYRVQWTPEVPGPFPELEGELAVESGDDYDSFTLRLSGNYTPPLGLVGQGFDVAVGNRVAQATANNLLHHIRDNIERAFEADEARKLLIRDNIGRTFQADEASRLVELQPEPT